MKSQEDTVAVMVVYRPPETVMRAVEALLPQVKALVVVDNGANAALREALGEKVIWLQNPENNLAQAQNLGIAKARELGADFVLLTDDDSEAAPGTVAALRKAWQPGIAVLGPYLDEPELAREPRYIQACGRFGFRRTAFGERETLRDLFYLAASGSLIPLAAIDAIGGMDEVLGMYFVDTDFCLRARAAGYDIAAVKAARLRHRFGKVTQHALLGWKVTTTNHPPAAREKMFRNRRVLWRRYGRSDPGYVIFDTLRAKSEALRVVLFEEHKMTKLAAIMRGLLGV